MAETLGEIKHWKWNLGARAEKTGNPANACALFHFNVFLKIYSFILRPGWDGECAHWGGRGRGREDPQADSLLSVGPDTGLNPTTSKS